MNSWNRLLLINSVCVLGGYPLRFHSPSPGWYQQNQRISTHPPGLRTWPCCCRALVGHQSHTWLVLYSRGPTRCVKDVVGVLHSTLAGFDSSVRTVSFASSQELLYTLPFYADHTSFGLSVAFVRETRGFVVSRCHPLSRKERKKVIV